MRIGVNTGEALVALERGADSEGVVGDVVNTAARLQEWLRSTPKGVTIQVYRPTGRPQYETATT